MARAIATVTLEIKCSSNWDDDTTIAQVRKQAIADAEDALRAAFGSGNPSVSIVGKIRIKTVTQEVN